MAEDLTRYVEEFVAAAVRDTSVAEFVRRVDDTIMAAIPAIRRDPVLVDDLHESTAAHWRAFVATLSGVEAQLPTEAVDFARSLARRGLHLGVLLKVYRVANQVVWRYVTELIEDVPDALSRRDTVLVFLYGRAGAWIDESIEQLIVEFTAEQERVTEGAVAGRIRAVEAVLAGDLDAEEASTALGHRLRLWQLGCVLWLPEAGAGAAAALQVSARAMADRLDAPGPLTLAGSTRELWCWVATRTPVDVAALATGLVADHALAEGVRGAFGEPGLGVAGFRSSHREARATQHLLLTHAGADRLVCYRDVDLLCLARGNEDLLDGLVDRELGALGDPTPAAALLRDTALVYLTSHRSVTAAAARLHVHKNTVRYRLGRAEDLLGRPLTERAAHLELALRQRRLVDADRATAR